MVIRIIRMKSSELLSAAVIANGKIGILEHFQNFFAMVTTIAPLLLRIPKDRPGSKDYGRRTTVFRWNRSLRGEKREPR